MESKAERDTHPYYYASGRKVELESADEFRAFESNKIRSGTKLSKEIDALVEDAGVHTYRNIVIVPTEAIPDRLSASLAKRDAFQPVYRHGETILVFLPEVRIEDDRPEYRKKIQSMLDEMAPDLKVDQRTYRAKVVPKSGRGTDALDLANQIQEKISPDFVQARMLRVAPKF